ncbi:carbohydrate ABC transporter permease [Marinibacterium profundimaris]|uniref:Sugar ABC transporter permease n=1 Tax=Marinibacterium profundimaris TaxID=1679460 RepID=A0A225NLM1_9RHOB|nr:carbohydrate ABC transporter permease [Marinibacterium profundimaris]OWU74967.1 sugar ABC transporter permease [Marinibacterium profundimaris]
MFRTSARQNPLRSSALHLVLIVYTLICVAPILLIIMNSFKSRRGIFGAPLEFPRGETFSLEGYETVFTIGNFPLYFQNSLIVTIVSLLLTVVFGAMAAFALSEYRYRGREILTLYMILGLMVPIRLGTVGILNMMAAAGISNTLTALILVYTAQHLPLAIFVMSELMRQVSDDLKNAARIDGLSEYRILFRLVMPVMRPAIATIAVFTMIPIWNDLWFPLVLAPSEETRTVTLGAQFFIGQFVTNWSAVLAALSLAIIPMLVLYMLFSRQIIRGITSGAVK